MRKIISAAAAAILLVTLVGCSTPKVVVEEQPAPVAEEPQAPPAPGPEEGARENPLPYGQTVTVYDTVTEEQLWAVTTSAPVDATADIAAANQFNEPPAAGNAYLAIPVTVTWLGSEPVIPWTDWQNGIDVAFVTDAGTTHQMEFVVQPWPAISDIAELYQGGSASFTTVVQAPVGAPGLVRVTASGFHFFVGGAS